MIDEPTIVYDDDNGEDEELIVKLKKLKEKLKKCRQEKEDYLIGWQRCQADFINYKRRLEEQMQEWSKMFGEGLLRDILPALDGLEAGIRNYELRIKDGDLETIRKQLWEILQQHGLSEMKSVGEKFNPEFHEAIETVEEQKESEGIIVEEVQKGYLLNGKVIRAAKVKISR